MGNQSNPVCADKPIGSFPSSYSDVETKDRQNTENGNRCLYGLNEGEGGERGWEVLGIICVKISLNIIMLVLMSRCHLDLNVWQPALFSAPLTPLITLHVHYESRCLSA